MKTKVNVPQKGAAKKWSKRLKELGEQPPPEGLMEILNQTEKPKSAAKPRAAKDLDV